MPHVLSPGTRIGVYEIQTLVGRGGMGEVYRAYDARLRRDVAVKVLPRTVASNPGYLARFEREAQTLAALNHPGIAHIYGVEHSEGLDAIVLEYVAGEDLAQRLTRGPLSVTNALSIARQIADALDSAHERGIIHRDLKPGNIKETPEGIVKLLDFGLAKAIRSSDAGNSEEEQTRTVFDTTEGVVVGTAAYMSPEQARGQAVDKRTDIWAFGCVLYEMLTGRAAFAGQTVSDTIATVLQREPNWNALPPTVPPTVRGLLERCLDKDPKRRQRDIGDARRDLDAPFEAVAQTATTISVGWSRVAWRAIPIVLAAAAAGWLMATLRTAPAPLTSEPKLTRVTWDGDFAIEPGISPDGTLVAYASNAGSQGNLDLWLQRAAGGAAVRLTQDAADDHAPDFSPDGSTIAFRAERGGGGVYLMPALGGDARLIAPEGRRPRFSPDGQQIAYWTGRPLGGTRNAGTAVFIVSVNGGTPRRVAENFVSARSPVWSPDGRGLLIFGRRSDSRARPAQALSPRLSTLLPSEFDWWWVPSGGGDAVATGVYPALTARAISFNPDTAGGDPLPDSWGPNGVLFSATEGQATNLWRVAVSSTTGTLEGPPQRLTTSAGADRHPSAARSGQVVFETSQSHEAILALALEPLVGKSHGRIDRLATGWEFGVHRGSVSRNGHVLAYPRQRPTFSEVWVKNLDTAAARHLVTTPPAQLNPTISPDGSQIGYTVVERDRSSAHVAAASGAPPRKICDDCEAHGWLSDNRRLIVQFPGAHPSIRLIDIDTLESQGVFDTDKRVGRVFATTDDRWIAFGAENVAWITALQPGHVGTPQSAQTITLPRSAVITSRICGWSADGRLLYSLLGLDGSRCLYAQRMDPSGATRPQPPFLVQHFHDAERAWGSTPMGNAITDRGFIFDQVETSASIWMIGSQPSPAR